MADRHGGNRLGLRNGLPGAAPGGVRVAGGTVTVDLII